MIDEFLLLDLYQQTKIIFGYITAACAVIGSVALVVKSKNAKEKRLVDLEARLLALDESKHGRVNLLHDLCKEQIKECRRATAVSSYVKGKLDAKEH